MIWIDAHPDVSTPQNGYPNPHAMVLGSLLGGGAPQLRELMDHPAFDPADILYVGLQSLHDYQELFLKDAGVPFKVQTDGILSPKIISAFLKEHAQVLVHLDIDVLSPHVFPNTYFANPELVGDGSGGGIMEMAQLHRILALINREAQLCGLTIAEHLPFAEYQLQQTLKVLDIFKA